MTTIEAYYNQQWNLCLCGIIFQDSLEIPLYFLIKSYWLNAIILFVFDFEAHQCRNRIEFMIERKNITIISIWKTSYCLEEFAQSSQVLCLSTEFFQCYIYFLHLSGLLYKGPTRN